MTTAQIQHSQKTENPRGHEATSWQIPGTRDDGPSSEGTIVTYAEVLEVVIDASYWMRVHELEALAEAAFAEFAANEPVPSFPYGRGFTGPVVLS